MQNTETVKAQISLFSHKKDKESTIITLSIDTDRSEQTEKTLTRDQDLQFAIHPAIFRHINWL